MAKYSIPYGRQTIDDDDINAVIETLKSDFMTQGPKISEFERAVADFHNSRYAIAFSNGTSALHGCYHACGIKPGEEFITSPITFAASANAGLYVGATPKFVDINSSNYCIDISSLEKSITDRTRVITPVSFAGYPVNIKEIRNIIGDRKITIIHDAAHAIGSLRDNAHVSELADMTVLSFHPVKHVATGEGGMVLTDSEDLRDKLSRFRTHGITKDPAHLSKNDGLWYYEMVELGFNYRITDLQCALGITQLKKLKKSLFRRNQIAYFYNKELSNISWLDIPDYDFDPSWVRDVSFENLNSFPANLHSYHLYPIKLKTPELRLKLYDHLRDNGIFSQVHYIPLHLMPYYRNNFSFKDGDFPTAEDFYSKELSLPMFPDLNDDQLEYIVDTIKDFR
ncbi:MAG: UDP-4-amino-4,6-dideoxy-N-acetyl-beta-L-altrosamine transaminase [Deltaproteobacteria bacterium]|nr:UDP-4-amino-4,6-dideoxy-N-acetyl-beta-L-altrosamine transaminase [Deltaproteobacteria bacterium]